ncbi:MAG: cyclic nucleotide-binding domain-containing protein [Planctomycetes bacterium]|nr:cyclic nucleotide-binding domain-containing protein [Planctomycetota bacterium]
MAVGPSDTKRIITRIPLFSGLTDEAYRLIRDGLEVRPIAKGTVIFRSGDPGDCVFIVKSGEVQIVAEGPGRAAEPLGSIRRGQIFGEMSLLTGTPRAATAIASLDSTLLVLRKAYFDVIVQKSPHAGRALSKLLSERLRGVTAGKDGRANPGILCIDGMLAPTETQAIGLEITRYLAMEFPDRTAFVDFGDEGPTAAKALGIREPALLNGMLDRFSSLSPEAIMQLSGQPHNGFRLLSLRDRAQAETRIKQDQIPQLLAYLKEAFAAVVIDVSGRAMESTLREKVLQQADRGLFLDRWATSGRMGRWGRTRDILERGRTGGAAALERVVVLPPGADLPTEPLLGSERPRYILQMEDVLPAGGGVPTGQQPTVLSLGRLVRHLSGTAVALALGGGYARACAHLGVLRVFEAENIPVDLIGGANVGAMIAALHAYGLNAEDVEKRFRLMLKDNPFALVGDKVEKGVEKWLRQLFSDVVIEGLPLPYFGIAADLQTGKEVVFSDDLAWKAVRASMALPGVLSPVYDNDRCLVDGVAVNNVPGDVARKLGGKLVIGVNVTPQADAYFLPLDRKRMMAEMKSGSGSGWFGRFARQSDWVQGFLDDPTPIRLLHRSLEVRAAEATRRNTGHFDLLIEPDINGIDLLDFRQVDKAVEAGEKAAKEMVAKVREKLAALRGRSAAAAPKK